MAKAKKKTGAKKKAGVIKERVTATAKKRAAAAKEKATAAKEKVAAAKKRVADKATAAKEKVAAAKKRIAEKAAAAKGKAAAAKKRVAEKAAAAKKRVASTKARVEKKAAAVAKKIAATQTVPMGNALPSIFEGLAEAGIEHSEFELSDPEESDFNLRAWLGGMPKDGSRVIVFAQDGTGSLFSLWLRANHADVETAPVVYLGSEGETAVLGKDPRAFIELLGSAMSFDGHTGTFFSDDEDEGAAELRERSANFAKQVLGLATLREPMVIKAEAEKAYPDLQAWIDANNAHR